MGISRRFWFAALLASAAFGWSQSGSNEPHIGYLYPAGGKQGTTVQVTVGGQFLQGVSNAIVSGGDGVHVSAVRYVGRLRPEQLREVQERIREKLKKLRAEANPTPAAAPAAWPNARPSFRPEKGFRPARFAPRPSQAPNKPAFQKRAPNGFAGKGGRPQEARNNFKAAQAAARQQAAAARKAAVLASRTPFVPKPARTAPPLTPRPEPPKPQKALATATAVTSAPTVNYADYPVLRDLDSLDLKQLEYMSRELLNPNKKQTNMQIGETVIVTITIDANAAPGERELRLLAPGGLTNPLRLEVGQFGEVVEHEPNNPDMPDVRWVDLPVVLNGQIMPGDVDRFRFRALKGQKLVIETKARALIPYLADAVPGWFQPTLALYDSKGNEIAYSDDYRFNPDPVLFYEIPSNDVYQVEIHDAIYRGREDFVYRVSIGERPFITGIFPLGGQQGVTKASWFTGWNLPGDWVPLDTSPGEEIRQGSWAHGPWLSNRVSYAIDSLPECLEKEPDDSPANAQRISLPQIVNGYIARPGDLDVFQFQGKKGDKIVAETMARRLGSPLDSLLKLSDTSGTVLASNDDHESKEAGLLTHHADSYLTATLPADGTYCVQVSDAQHQGSALHGYRLRVGPPQPDFALRMTPSSINLPAGHTAQFSVYALRKDGFDGDIEIALKDDAASSFTLSGGHIPAGRDQVRMTLTAGVGMEAPVAVHLEGRAQIGGQTLRHPVVPAEDMMQAFAYRHLVPSQELMVASKGKGPKRWTAAAQLADSSPIRIPLGSSAQVRVKVPWHGMLPNVALELRDAPKGVSLDEITSGPKGLAFAVKASSDAEKAPSRDNLVVEAFMETASGDKDAKAKKKKNRFSLGVLPAIPYEIVKR